MYDARIIAAKATPPTIARRPPMAPPGRARSGAAASPGTSGIRRAGYTPRSRDRSSRAPARTSTSRRGTRNTRRGRWRSRLPTRRRVTRPRSPRVRLGASYGAAPGHRRTRRDAGPSERHVEWRLQQHGVARQVDEPARHQHADQHIVCEDLEESGHEPEPDHLVEVPALGPPGRQHIEQQPQRDGEVSEHKPMAREEKAAASVRPRPMTFPASHTASVRGPSPTST